MPKPVINIKFLADLKQFSTGMQNATRRIDRMGKKMQRVGAGLTVGLTLPLLAFGAASAKAFDEQDKAIAQVNAGLKSTGGIVGLTSEKLQKMAADLQKTTLFGDEEILKGATAQLLTFTNITGRQFARTQKAALDLATRLDGDLKSAAIQLGKALNDPVANLSALSRSGIQFSKEQKTVINSLVAAGKAAEAQTIILDELEKQYGGSAEAAAKAGTGPFKQLGNILGDIKEDFGAIIVEGLLPFVQKLKELASGFSDLSPQTKKFIVILGGVAAAAGPLLVLAGTILPAIATGLTLLTGPIGLVVAGLTAIGVVIYKNWRPIKKTLINIANYFIDLYNESTVFRVGVEGVISAFKSLYAIGKFVFDALGSIIGRLAENIKNAFSPLGDFIKAILTGDIQKLPEILAAGFKNGITSAKGLIADLDKDFEVLKTSISNNMTEGVRNALSGKKYKLLSENVDVSAVEQKTAEAVAAGLATGGTVVPGGRGTPQTEKLKLATEGVVDPLGPVAGQIKASTDNIGVAIDTVSKKLTAFQENADIVGNAVGDAFGNMAGNFIDSLGLAENGIEGFAKNLLKSVTKIISILLAESVAFAIQGGTASGAATGPGAVVAIPSMVAALTAAVIGAFAAIPKFATGGIFGGSSFYGDKILARVNSGELVLNQQQQKNALALIDDSGGQSVFIPEVVLRGEDLVMSFNRANKKINRLG